MPSIVVAFLSLVALGHALPNQNQARQTFNGTILIQSSSAANYASYVVHAFNGANSTYYNLALANFQFTEGTQFTTSPSTSNANTSSINFSIDGVDYGMHLPGVGDAEGVAENITALEDYYGGEWGFTETGALTYQLQDALDYLLICDSPEGLPLLSYGHPNLNGTMPAGCVEAEIFKTTGA